MAQGRPGFPSRFRQLLYQEQYDAVHGHLHYLSGYLLRLAAECGVPVRVAHFRSSRPDPIAAKVLEKIEGKRGKGGWQPERG